MAERPFWKLLVAGILDFLLVFVGAGYLIARATGNTTDGGFQLNGWPAVILFAIVFLYFWGMRRLGGTVFRRILGVAP